MIPKKYLEKLKSEILEFNQNRNLKFFIFGSSIERKHFGDIDVGFMGRVNVEDIRKSKEKFTESTLPYNIDIIDFNVVSPDFKKNVFSDKILWLTPSD